MIARSHLAEKLLPAKGLFRAKTPPSMQARRARLALHVLPLPILLRGLSDVGSAVIAIGNFGLFIAAVWVLGEGLRAEDDWRARAVAKAPRVKLRLLSAAMMGAAIGLAFVSDHNTSGLASVMAAVLGAGLHLSAFGFDPSTDKQGCGITAFDAERIDELSTAVDPHLARISTLAKASGDAALMQESAALLIVVTHRMQALKANPQAATQVRKMVSVWLPALAQAMQQGHDLEAIGHKPERIDKLAETMSEVRSRIEAMVISTQASADTRLESDLAVLRDSLR